MRGKENTTSGQLERGCKTSKARENSGDQGAVNFRLESDWLKGWREFSELITVQSYVKLTQSQINNDTDMKIALIGSVTECNRTQNSNESWPCSLASTHYFKFLICSMWYSFSF